jgi:hypothetical protein
MKRLTLSLLAATFLAAPVASGATVAGAPVAFAQTADEPERAAVPDGRPLESGGNPYYGPGWSGPVNQAPLPVCPAWYGAHTDCLPSSR